MSTFQRFAMVITTLFGLGFSKFAPGTVGSIFGLITAWLIVSNTSTTYLIVATIFVFFIGVFLSSIYSKYLNTNDPSRIIIDELVGQWITLFFLPPDLLYYLIGFLLFRFFDIFKPWPANWADRKLHGGLGIMLDDVFAGIYSCIIVSSLFHMIG